MAALFIVLGLWQLRRHDEQRTTNAVIAARTATVRPLEELAGEPEELEFSRAEAVGEWDIAEEVVLRPRVRNGVEGQELITPLVLPDGQALLINRGWVPLALGDPPVTAAQPAPGPAAVVVALVRSQEPSSFGPQNPPEGDLEIIRRVDVERLERQTPYDLFPLYAVLVESDPAQPPELLPVEAPGPGNRPNLSYAGQWFLLATVVVVGYGLLLRRTAAAERAQS